MAPKPRPAIERMMEKVARDPETDCWNFMGYRNPDGYGRLGAATGAAPWMTHRLSYLTFVGPIPDGYQVDHLCRNRACCNPAHLEAVTARVNTFRSASVSRLNAEKTHCVRGHEFSEENTPTSRLAAVVTAGRAIGSSAASGITGPR